MGSYWGDEPPSWYREGKLRLDEFLKKTHRGVENPERILWELEQKQKELNATRRNLEETQQQIIATKASAEEKQQEVARLDASFNKQLEEIKTYEENLVAQRE